MQANAFAVTFKVPQEDVAKVEALLQSHHQFMHDDHSLSGENRLNSYSIVVIDAAQEFNRVLPLFMTAAGKVTPANVLVIGAGVAGLQAIATAKRLGAIVYATDVRIASF